MLLSKREAGQSVAHPFWDAHPFRDGLPILILCWPTLSFSGRSPFLGRASFLGRACIGASILFRCVPFSFYGYLFIQSNLPDRHFSTNHHPPVQPIILPPRLPFLDRSTLYFWSCPFVIPVNKIWLRARSAGTLSKACLPGPAKSKPDPTTVQYTNLKAIRFWFW
jgi:hypothetical protein